MTATQIVINVHGGVVQEVFVADPSTEVILVDWDVDDADAHDPQVVTTRLGENLTQRAFVVRVPGRPTDDLVGTEVAAAIEAAELCVH